MNNDVKFQEFSIKEYIFIIRLHIKKIIFFTLLGFIFGFYNNLITPPLYLASSSVLIKEQPGVGMVMDMTGTHKQDKISNAMQMIKSRAIAKETVKIIWARYKNNLELFGSYPFYPRGRRIRQFMKNIITFGKSKNNLEKRISYEEPYSDDIGNRFGSIIESRIKVNHLKNTDIIKISYGSVWPEEAKLIVNTLTKVYKDFEKKIGAEEAINAVGFLEKLVEEQEKKLNNAEENLTNYQNKEQIYGENEKSNAISSQILELENQILNLNSSINIGREKIKLYKSKLSKEEKLITEKVKNTLNMQVQALRSSISMKESELIVNSAQYGSNHNAVIELNIQIKTLKEKLDKKIVELVSKGIDIDDPLVTRQNLISEILLIDSEEKLFKIKINEFQNLIKILKDKLEMLPPKLLEYSRLERNTKVILQNYTIFREKLENARITVASQVGQAQILDLASVPKNNINDNKRNILMGLLFGIAAGFGLAFGLEFLDSSVKTIYDIEKHNLSVLGVIPSMNESDVRTPNFFDTFLFKNLSENNTAGRQLITLDNPKSPISEAYRSLRTSLLYNNPDNQIKSLLISSAGPGDGKTTTVANLAITLANMGKKTILIDTDLRRPVVNKVFKCRKSPGITEFLNGHIEDFNKIVVESKIKNLFIVPSGIVPPNPSELLGSNKLIRLIKKLESEWDMVLFDSPPLVAVTDATMVSKEIDQIIIVVKVGKTEKKAFEHTINALKNINAPLGGIVLNAVSEKDNYGGYYYYYQYYHYYGSDNEN